MENRRGQPVILGRQPLTQPTPAGVYAVTDLVQEVSVPAWFSKGNYLCDAVGSFGRRSSSLPLGMTMLASIAEKGWNGDT
jgi:hypothetical protein